MEELVAIQKIKKGDLLKIGNSVYVACGYNRFAKRYQVSRWDDINSFRDLKKNHLVTTNFDF